MRYWILTSLLLIAGRTIEAQDHGKPAEKAEPLKEKVAQAELVAVGKITGTIEVGAGSFYYVTLELTDVLKGPKDKKKVAFRVGSVPGREPPPYTKKGSEGVWLLGNPGKSVMDVETRGLLSYLPLKELPAVREVLPKAKE